MNGKILMLFASLLLSACEKSDLAVRDMESIREDATVVAAQKGRFQLVPPRDGYPAIIFDTATGCAEALNMETVGPNAGIMLRSGLVAPQPECSRLEIVPLRLKNRKPDAP